jgi:hypothetical protein
MPQDFRIIEITSDSPALTLRAWLGETGGTLKGGFGGWKVTDRPHRVGITEWMGRDPYGMDLSIIVDSYLVQQSVEDDIRILERMGLPGMPLPGYTPPLLTLKGAVPRPDLQWVLNDITYGALIRHRDGYRMRQEFTLDLLRYVMPDTAEISAAEIARAAVKKSTKGNTKTYTAKEGDTLFGIAAQFLGSGKLWKKIGDANDIRDPYAVKKGDDIIIP